MKDAWTIKYWTSESGRNEIERWFNKLTEEQAESVTKELMLLRKSGNNLKLPHSRSLGKKLFELREQRYGYRMYYTFHGEQIIVLLVAGNKSTQKNDIKVARDRIEKLIKHIGGLL